MLGDLSAAFGDSTPAEAEIEILRSRAIVGAVVDELRLDLVARPRRFPLVGGALARRHDPEDGVALGGARVRALRLGRRVACRSTGSTCRASSSASRSRSSPARAGGSRCAIPTASRSLEGEVGKAATRTGLEIFVSALVARPGTEFRVVRSRRDEVVSDLQKDLRISEKGKKTGILQLALEGDDPVRVAAMLDAVSRAYLRQNVERKSAEAEKTLEFLEKQLPRAALERWRPPRASSRATARRRGPWTSRSRRRPPSRAPSRSRRALSELQLEYAALRQRFTDDHPAARRDRSEASPARGRARRPRRAPQEAARRRARERAAHARREGRERALPHAPQQGAGAEGREGGDDRERPYPRRGHRPGEARRAAQAPRGRAVALPRARRRRRARVRAPRARSRASRIRRPSSATSASASTRACRSAQRADRTPSGAPGASGPVSSSSRTPSPDDLAVESLR